MVTKFTGTAQKYLKGREIVRRTRQLKKEAEEELKTKEELEEGERGDWSKSMPRSENWRWGNEGRPLNVEKERRVEIRSQTH